MNELESVSSSEITERERVLNVADLNPVFRMVAQTLSDLVKEHGIPEREIEAVLSSQGDTDLIRMFRLLRTVAAVTERLTRSPRTQTWAALTQEQLVFQHEQETSLRQQEYLRRLQDYAEKIPMFGFHGFTGPGKP